MYIKRIPSISLKSLVQVVTGPSLSYKKEDKDVLGIEMEEDDIVPALYKLIAKIEIPFIPIVSVAASVMNKDLQKYGIGLAEGIIPLLMHPTQYHHFSCKVLLIKTQGHTQSLTQEWNNLLLKELRGLGLKNVAVYFTGTDARNGISLFVETQQNGDTGSYPVNWEVSFFETADELLNGFTNISVQTNTLPDQQILELKEENAELRGSNATLLKNIYDLNSYYRFVRGETTFKYNNRNTDDNLVGKAAQTLPPGAGIDEYKKYYYQLYDRLPTWYKKIGALLKIALLKKELWYYLSKRHKKAFFDILYSMPDEKQIKAWYYYEYEILPNWYKRLGKLL